MLTTSPINDMKKYVVGFAFDESMKTVVMIMKNRPDWQAGMLNGVGGKVEKNESFIDAMAREFKEETGVDIPKEDWIFFGTVNGHANGENFEVRFYRTLSDNITQCRSTTDEDIVIMPLTSMGRQPMVSNALVMLTAAIEPTLGNTMVTITFKE